MEDHIKPALNIITDGKSELSPQEFQRQLYSWFEDRGLLAELRAHLRLQMINIIKSTGIGRNTVKQGISPKLQALNMLIAEFFLHQEYHYSLCVFTTEVPLANIFPDMPNSIIRKKSSTEVKLMKWRFTEKDMWDLLETLGIKENSEEGDYIKKLYYNTDDESLLTSLIRMLYKMKLDKEEPNKLPANEKLNTSINVIKDGSFDVIYENIAQLLAKFHINNENIAQILDLIKFIVNEEKKLLENKYRKEFNLYKQKIEEEIMLKAQEYQNREEDIEKLYVKEKKRLEDEFHKGQLNMKNYSESLQRRYEEFQIKCEALKKRESEIQKKEEEFIVAKKIFQKDVEQLYVEKVMIQDLQKNCELNQKLKPDVNGNDLQKNENLKERKISSERVQETSNQLHIENALLKQTIRQLELENTNLRNQNSDCQKRVKELADHAKKIKSDLHIYESRYGFRSVGRNTDSNLSVPNMQKTKNVTNEGNGEQISSYPTSVANFHTKTYDVKRNSRHRRHNNQASSEELSYTEEILQETKLRLRNLERESEEIDRNFMEYYTKKLTKPNIGNINK